MKFENEKEFGECPFCKGEEDELGMAKGMLIVLKDWANMYNSETLLHCLGCDAKFIVYYKFDKIVLLVEKKVKPWSIEKEDDDV